MRTLHAPLLLLVLGALLGAQTRTPIRLASDASLSPDGTRIAFSWRGDVWTADSEGGVAKRLSWNAARDWRPAFSPDGTKIAFLSDRDARAQIHVIPAQGGTPERRTPHTDGYDLQEWLPDGEGFLVRASRDHWWRDSSRFFLQPKHAGPAPQLVFDDYGANGRLSPDGTKLLFTRESTRTYRKNYRGSQASQVWLYDLKEKSFRLLHREDGGCRWPLWLPDGEHYLYVSQSSGTWNLWKGNLRNDHSEQLTHFEDDGVLFPSISRDGSTVVFTRLFDLFRLDLKTRAVGQINLWARGRHGQPRVVRETLKNATAVSYASSGNEVAFIAGGDLWVMDTELREPVRVTNTPEEERNPVFVAKDELIVFESDAGGQPDLWTAERSDSALPFWRNQGFDLKRITDDELSESEPRALPDGKRISFTHGSGDIVLMKPDGSERRTLLSCWTTPSYDFSPDSRWIVYSHPNANYNHEVYILPLDGSRPPFNLSCHPDNDRSPRWSADGRFIAFIGRRNETESDVYWVPLTKETAEESARDRRLKKALAKTKAKKSSPPAKKAKKKEAPSDPLSGSWKGRAETPAQPNPIPFEIVFRLEKDNSVGGTFSSPMGSGPVEGSFDPKKQTVSFSATIGGQSLDADGKLKGDELSGTWEGPDAEGIWEAKRVSKPDAKKEVAKEGAEKKGSEKKTSGKSKRVTIDFDGIRDRLRRVMISNSTERSLLWSASKSTLYFRATMGSKSGMHSIEIPGSLSPRYVASSFGSDPHWIQKGKRLGCLLSGTPATMSTSGSSQRHSFTVYTEEDRLATHRAVFDQAWRLMRDRYYDENLGNRDWDAIRAKYGAMAAACEDASEVSRVVTMMLGELNGSHLGFRMSDRRRARSASDSWQPSTVHLGVRFDASYGGPGLRVAEVVERSPAAMDRSRIEVGEVIASIDGRPLSPDLDTAPALTVRPDSTLKLRVRSTEGEWREVSLRPVSTGRIRGLLYEQWIRFNERKVHEASQGRLGYLHIRSMGRFNLVRFDADLYRRGHDKEGLIIDVRENGGGSITDHLLTCLTQPTHAICRTRTSGRGYPHDRRVYATWDKPVAVLCNQNSFSNAEIFSHAIKTLKRGQVIGVPTAGGVISTGGASIMGRAFLRMPTRGWYIRDTGEDMELNGCVPHHTLWPLPGELPQGIDRQLSKAVDVLLKDCDLERAKPEVKLRKASERKR